MRAGAGNMEVDMTDHIRFRAMEAIRRAVRWLKMLSLSILVYAGVGAVWTVLVAAVYIALDGNATMQWFTPQEWFWAGMAVLTVVWGIPVEIIHGRIMKRLKARLNQARRNPVALDQR
jgi:hypothetical protein